MVEQNEVEKIIEQGTSSSSGDREQFGPWMQVSYGRIGRNVGVGHTGKTTSNHSSFGHTGKITYVQIGAGVSGNGKDLGNTSADLSKKVKDNGKSGNISKMNSNLANGSRFAVLDEESTEEINVTTTQSRVGPFKFNGVPLRHVNQSYVIGTSTKVNISRVNVEKFDDKYFAKESEEKKSLSQEKKDNQKAVDTPLIKSI
ncbi:hypothetical protein Q3G72_005818 [Acer saccharum]|nr:hypothetical protein Q3G72_005818 [Acer saccharum]